MKWTTERRYRLYQDWTQEEIQHIKENMAQSPWHTHYHVEPSPHFPIEPKISNRGLHQKESSDKKQPTSHQSKKSHLGR